MAASAVPRTVSCRLRARTPSDDDDQLDDQFDDDDDGDDDGDDDDDSQSESLEPGSNA